MYALIVLLKWNPVFSSSAFRILVSIYVYKEITPSKCVFYLPEPVCTMGNSCTFLLWSSTDMQRSLFWEEESGTTRKLCLE